MTTHKKNLILMPLNILHRISPTLALKILFRLKKKRKLDLKNPKTYTEKVQWMKLHYHHPLLTKLVDKYTVRDYVAQKAPEILVPLLWQGFDARDIPWDDLPDRFVMKTTHGSTFNIICWDKSKLDREECVKKLNGWLKTKFLRCYGEWFYGVEKPRIIIEEFLDVGEGRVPEDYKIFCFDGKPHIIVVHTGRFVGQKTHLANIYDLEWNFREGHKINFENDVPMEKPEQLDELLRYARLLSEDFIHVRVDLYLVKGKVYFGEMTFTNGAGYSKISPPEFDEELGSLLPLREK